MDCVAQWYNELRAESMCLWRQGLNVSPEVQPRHRKGFPYSGTIDGTETSRNDNIRQCDLNSILNATDDPDGNDKHSTDIGEDMDDHHHNAAVELGISVFKDKVRNTGIMLTQDVKRFVDHTTDVERMMHVNWLSLRQGRRS